jgi:modulator of smoothened protein
MDKLSIISGALFLAADVFAIASLCMPNWIVSTVSGKLNVLSLNFNCYVFHVCY